MTKNEIRAKLETNQTWLERAVIAVYDSWNYADMGFLQEDYWLGKRLAAWLKQDKSLTGNYINQARQLMLKDVYLDQLVKISNMAPPVKGKVLKQAEVAEMVKLYKEGVSFQESLDRIGYYS